MQGLVTDKSKPKEISRRAEGEKSRKTTVIHALDLPDFSFEQIRLRSETETTVLKRFLYPS